MSLLAKWREGFYQLDVADPTRKQQDILQRLALHFRVRRINNPIRPFLPFSSKLIHLEAAFPRGPHTALDGFLQPHQIVALEAPPLILARSIEPLVLELILVPCRHISRK